MLESSLNPRASDHGFTLVEVLISLFIFSLISVGAMMALQSTLDVRERSGGRIERLDDLIAARRIMAEDFAARIERSNRDGLGSMIDPGREVFKDDELTLVRRGRANPGGEFPRGDLWRIEYRVEDGALIRAFYPHENPARLDDPVDRILLRGVEAMHVRPEFPPGSSSAQRSLNMSIFSAPLIVIELTHSDGTETEHVFETGAELSTGGVARG